jgi:hypothetical protein
MSDRESNFDEAVGKFGEPVRDDEETASRHRRDVSVDRRRKGALKRGVKKVGVWTGIGIVGAAAGHEILQNMDGKPLGSFAGAPKSGPRVPGVETGTPAPEAGSPGPDEGVDVSQPGTTGTVEFDDDSTTQ